MLLAPDVIVASDVVVAVVVAVAVAVAVTVAVAILKDNALVGIVVVVVITPSGVVVDIPGTVHDDGLLIGDLNALDRIAGGRGSTFVGPRFMGVGLHFGPDKSVEEEEVNCDGVGD